LDRDPEIKVLVIDPGNELAITQKVKRPWTNRLADLIARRFGRAQDLRSSGRPQAKQSSNAVAGEQSGLEPSRMMTEGGEEDVDDRRVRAVERDAIGISEEGVLNKLTIDGCVRGEAARGDGHCCHLTFDVRGGLRLAAGRPLDGGVRKMTLSKAATGTQRHRRSRETAWLPDGATPMCEDFVHWVFAG
jgi:hypothetical protein